MDCSGVLLTVDDGCLPSAATSAAKAPAPATKGAVGQFSGAAWAGTFGYCDSSQSSRTVEHAFAKRSARMGGSASLQSEAEVSEIGRTNPPAQLARGRSDLQSAGSGLDCSNRDQLPRVNIYTGAGRIPSGVVVEHSVGCLSRFCSVQLQVRGSDDISFEVDADLPVS